MHTLEPGDRGHRWSIVLAGGDGRRCRTHCNRLYTDGRPKQFCALAGQRSLVEETLDRARLFSAQEQTVVSVCRKHLQWRHLWEARHNPVVSIQPSNADTGPATLLALTSIQCQHPDATIALFPSDHYVSDRLRFMGAVREGAIWVERHPDHIVMLAIRATEPEVEYGWLLEREGEAPRPGQPRPALLIEKPERMCARRLLERGSYWNTSVLVFRLKLLMRLMEIFAREWWFAFNETCAWSGTDLDLCYERLPGFNLSRDVLQSCPQHLYMMPIEGVQWADLGTDKQISRLRRCLTRTASRHAPASLSVSADS